jgi:hypothetical protein
MMGVKSLKHARDRVVEYHRKRTTAVCGARVILRNTVYTDSDAFRAAGKTAYASITCNACLTILIEREKGKRS